MDKSLLSDGKNTVQAKQWLDKCYLASASSETTVKRSRTDTYDAERSGRPNSVVVLGKKELQKLVLADRKLKLREIVEELKISKGGEFKKSSCKYILFLISLRSFLHPPLSLATVVV